MGDRRTLEVGVSQGRLAAGDKRAPEVSGNQKQVSAGDQWAGVCN